MQFTVLVGSQPTCELYLDGPNWAQIGADSPGMSSFPAGMVRGNEREMWWGARGRDRNPPPAALLVSERGSRPQQTWSLCHKNPGPTCLLHTVLVSTRVCTFTTLRVHGLLSGACVCVSPPLLQQGNSETLRASRPRHNPKRPWPIPKEKDGVFA